MVLSTPVIVELEGIKTVLGRDATQELVTFVSQVAAAASSTKVDRAEYDAHSQLITTQFQAQNELAAERDKSLRAEFRSEMKAQIRGALLAGLAWVTVLIAGLFGALYAVVG